VFPANIRRSGLALLTADQVIFKTGQLPAQKSAFSNQMFAVCANSAHNAELIGRQLQQQQRSRPPRRKSTKLSRNKSRRRLHKKHSLESSQASDCDASARSAVSRASFQATLEQQQEMEQAAREQLQRDASMALARHFSAASPIATKVSLKKFARSRSAYEQQHELTQRLLGMDETEWNDEESTSTEFLEMSSSPGSSAFDASVDEDLLMAQLEDGTIEKFASM